MNIDLVKWSQELKKDLIKICNEVDPRYLSNRIPHPYTEKDAEWWLEMVNKHEEQDGVFRAIVVDGKIVGNISIEQKSDVYCKDSEIGYVILTEYWSKGIATEATKRICDIAFEKLNIERITGLVYASNEASKKVLLKNGFLQEGVKRKAVFKNDTLDDLYIFGKVI